ncbi:ArsR/SmtB family transcription factor [Aquibacillus saliphilus]|uniref:ArsR/SmtB family transcription factor n=1 Tax=Aquibacillus saliphilus TaxID=1909422 RepID=UPI001CEFBECA|nr:ArsR family transcriptional regulator [Aquibacillus saliphilus]
MKDLHLTMDNALEVCKAISNEHRINILKLLSRGPHNVNDLSKKLGIPFSTTAVNVKKLEEMDLIISELVPGRGTKKVNSKNFDRIIIDLFEEDNELEKNNIRIDMPVGEYIVCKTEPSCGLVGTDDYIGMQDDPRSFYETSRRLAQLLYFKAGYVEYRYPNRVPYGAQPTEVEFSVEICSEAPYHKLDWPSDITFWVNDIEVGTWTSPGDFGGQRGFNTPKWWGIHFTQYGLLKNWKVNKDGTFLDGVKIFDVRIEDLKLNDNPFISLRIGVKEDALNVGGVNLFGREFGNYKQGIIMNLRYE